MFAGCVLAGCSNLVAESVVPEAINNAGCASNAAFVRAWAVKGSAVSTDVDVGPSGLIGFGAT